MREISEAELDAFEADMVRLSRRNYPEVGVAMFLVPEDLTGSRQAPTAADPEGARLADEFAAICAALERRNGPLTTNDLAHVLEVLADRSFLDHPFSDFSDVEPRA